MSSEPQNVYLITGANRGLGLGLLTTFLLRPHTTIVACVRDPTHDTCSKLPNLPRSPTSTLHILKLDSLCPSDFSTLYLKLTNPPYNITHIDTLIANSGDVSSLHSVLETTPEQVHRHIEINTNAPLRLLQSCWSLLTAAATTTTTARPPPKYFYMSSGLGSISMMDVVPGVAYGISKAGGNYLVRRLHLDHEKEGVVSVALSPGWVRTPMGDFAADSWNVSREIIPLTVEESVRGMVEVIDKATREEHGGKFVNYDGKILGF